jgi:hypothetical protein
MVFVLMLVVPFFMALNRQDYLFIGFIFIFTMLCMTESALEIQKGIGFFSIIFPLLAFQRQTYQMRTPTFSFSSARS